MHIIDANWLNGSQIFFNLAVGISSGVFVGLKTVSKFINDNKQKRVEIDARKDFPREKLNTRFLLVDTAEAPGKIYLIDKDKKTRHWIASASTMQDLNYHWSDVNRISKAEFDKYKEGAAILTSGVPGT